MPGYENEVERENRYAAVFEENRIIKQENRMMKQDMLKHERNLRALEEMVNRLQEAIVNQALLIGLALEWRGDEEDEATED